jgi:hypothetical protein
LRGSFGGPEDWGGAEGRMKMSGARSGEKEGGDEKKVRILSRLSRRAKKNTHFVPAKRGLPVGWPGRPCWRSAEGGGQSKQYVKERRERGEKGSLLTFTQNSPAEKSARLMVSCLSSEEFEMGKWLEE